MATMIRYFDRKTKMGFENSSRPCYIRFGSRKDSDLSMDIRMGILKLSGQVFLFRTWCYYTKAS